jgi:hypothetical protein
VAIRQERLKFLVTRWGQGNRWLVVLSAETHPPSTQMLSPFRCLKPTVWTLQEFQAHVVGPSYSCLVVSEGRCLCCSSSCLCCAAALDRTSSHIKQLVHTETQLSHRLSHTAPNKSRTCPVTCHVCKKLFPFRIGRPKHFEARALASASLPSIFLSVLLRNYQMVIAY